MITVEITNMGILEFGANKDQVALGAVNDNKINGGLRHAGHVTRY
jgi:hypothetical protein